MRAALAALSALLLLAGAGGARAERLILSLSKQHVTISSSFTGEQLVLFGAVEARDPGLPDKLYDIAVTVRGPETSFVTWRKQRRLGLWMNVDSRSFLNAPSYLAVMTNRPPAMIASAEVLRQEQIGLVNNRFLQRVGPDFADSVAEDPFRVAFLRVKQQDGLYHEEDEGVTLIARNLFRTTIPIPGTAPIGTYSVVVKAFSGGELVGTAISSIDVQKTDFEATVATAARDQSLLYGIITAIGALAIGFLANLAFRRD